MAKVSQAMKFGILIIFIALWYASHFSNEMNMHMTYNPSKIIIIGAGPVGMHTAIDLAHLGYEIWVFEKRNATERMKRPRITQLEHKYLFSLGYNYTTEEDNFIFRRMKNAILPNTSSEVQIFEDIIEWQTSHFDLWGQRNGYAAVDKLAKLFLDSFLHMAKDNHNLHFFEEAWSDEFLINFDPLNTLIIDASGTNSALQKKKYPTQTVADNGGCPALVFDYRINRTEFNEFGGELQNLRTTRVYWEAKGKGIYPWRFFVDWGKGANGSLITYGETITFNSLYFIPYSETRSDALAKACNWKQKCTLGEFKNILGDDGKVLQKWAWKPMKDIFHKKDEERLKKHRGFACATNRFGYAWPPAFKVKNIRAVRLGDALLNVPFTTSVGLKNGLKMINALKDCLNRTGDTAGAFTDCYTEQACEMMEYWLLSDAAEEFTRVDNPTRNMETKKEFFEISAGYCAKKI